MKQQAGKFYVYAVPLLLFSFRMAVFICAKDAAKENATITLSSPATAHTVVLPLVMTTPETWHPFVAQIPAKEKAKEGETVALNCQFHSPWGPSLSKLTVKWYKEDEKGQSDLLENNVTVLTNYSRAFIHGNISQGDASLTILNVTASDHGIYFCQVTLSSGKVVMGSGTKLRIRRALGLFGIEESIGTIIGVVAAGVGGLVVLIIVLTPRLRKCLLCIKQAPHQDNPTLDVTACMDIAHHSPTKNLEGSPCPQTPTQRDTLNRHRPFRNTDLSLNSSPAPFSLNHCSYPHHLRPYMDFLPVAAKNHRSTEGHIFKAAHSRLLGVKRSAGFFKSA